MEQNTQNNPNKQSAERTLGMIVGSLYLELDMICKNHEIKTLVLHVQELRINTTELETLARSTARQRYITSFIDAVTDKAPNWKSFFSSQHEWSREKLSSVRQQEIKLFIDTIINLGKERKELFEYELMTNAHRACSKSPFVNVMEEVNRDVSCEAIRFYKDILDRAADFQNIIWLEAGRGQFEQLWGPNGMTHEEFHNLRSGQGSQS